MAFGQAIRAHLCQPGGHDGKSNFTLSPTKASWPLSVWWLGYKYPCQRVFLPAFFFVGRFPKFKKACVCCTFGISIDTFGSGLMFFFTEDACTLTLMALVLDEFRSVTAWFQVHLKKMLGWSMCCCTMAMCCFKGFQWAQCLLHSGRSLTSENEKGWYFHTSVGLWPLQMSSKKFYLYIYCIYIYLWPFIHVTCVILFGSANPSPFRTPFQEVIYFCLN